MLRCAKILLKHPGSASATDFYGARLVTIARPGALNSLTYPAFKDLYTLYVSSPHPEENAIYIVRGDGTKAFSAGGDLVALTADTEKSSAHSAHASHPSGGISKYAHKYFLCEYIVDAHIATMRRCQVALWAGHVYGSGVGISLHGSHRVCFNNTKFAMPEVQLGTVPDVGSQYVFARLPVKGLGPYLALTGSTLSGADVFHAGLATHYASMAAYESILYDLTQVRSPQEVADVLDNHTGGSGVPPFSLAPDLATLERCFHIEEDTTVQDVLARLAEDGRAFAKTARETMLRNSPTAMCLTLEAFKKHRAARKPVDSLQLDYKLIQLEVCLADFKEGADARVVRKDGKPRWNPATVDQVDMNRITEALNTPGYTLDLTAKMN